MNLIYPYIKYFYRHLHLVLIFSTIATACSQAISTSSPKVRQLNLTGIPSQSSGTESLTSNIRIPSQADWVDHGLIFEAGVEGEWDYYLWGGFALSAIKKDGTYYLYYQGASDYRTEYDETVMWRSIGVATSSDGIHFTKYESNPILTWFPNQNGEEGVVSSGVTMGENRDLLLFYGANTQETSITVNADVQVASSFDGLNFHDLGIVLNRKDRSVWGYGDELFSVDAIYDSGRWIVYYIPNGTTERGKLGVAHGTQYNRLSHSSMVTSNGKPVSVWGTAAHVKLSHDIYALMLNNLREEHTEVRLMSLQAPNILSEPVAVYQFEEAHQAVFLLDEEKATWFMYYYDLEGNGYGVKSAPASLP